MGKRKERRLAALSNAGRRVKLDLFAEPSGDLGGSTEHDEDGVDKESNHRDGLPNSPTSSGQQPQNPLLLLGQYSDDELEEESSKELNHATVESSSPNDEVKHLPDEDYKDMEVNAGEDLSIHQVKQQERDQESIPTDVSQNLEGSDKIDSDPTISGDLQQEMDVTEQNSISGISDVQVGGDVTLGWKMVMHEESNRYYYWNIETGETSWEEPDVLARANGLTNGQTIPTVTEKTEIAPVGVDEPNIISGGILGGSSAAHPLEGTMSANMIPQGIEVYGHGYQLNDCNDKNEAWKDSNWSTDVNPRELKAGSEKDMHDMIATEGHESGVALSSHLVQQCECLLEKLKSLKGSDHHLQGHDLISKYILELEIRLSDLKSLSSCGSSLLPFWLHSEKKLKQLESVINDEIYEIAKSTHIDEVEATHVSAFCGKGKLQESMGYEPEANGTETKGVLSTSENSDVASYVYTSTVVQKVSHNKEPLVNAEHGSSLSSPTRFLSSGEGVNEQVSGAAELGDESTHEHRFNAAEDVDMDVDMEVEDATSSGNTTAMVALNSSDFPPLEHPIQPNPPTDYPSLVSEDGFIAPPPPDDEWIPPLPPDNEHIPPPPPDEPPEPSYPPPASYTETGQPLSYTEQYNLSYPDSSFEYNVHSVVQVPSSNLYGHVEGSQVAVPHAPIYYGTDPNTYTETAIVILNPVQPVAYYGLHDGTIPSVPGVSGAESSGFHSESASVSYDSLPAEQVASVDPFMGVGHNSSLNVNVNISAVGGEPDTASLEVPSTSASIQAPAIISVKESVSVPPTDTVAAAAVVATSMSTKVQSKVLRSKKRTTAVAPSLRSNKKVSSLVDKWKAAKEELREDEKEPEDAYQILERKRQREIEEWRSRQIASGEAKDNANFQPLGGDWRERVKRRRAQLAKEAAKTPPEAHSDGNQQPDLIELSRDLLSGWQAYWDESSKQVYYGNSDTSETTWTRPTK